MKVEKNGVESAVSERLKENERKRDADVRVSEKRRGFARETDTAEGRQKFETRAWQTARLASARHRALVATRLTRRQHGRQPRPMRLLARGSTARRRRARETGTGIADAMGLCLFTAYLHCSALFSLGALSCFRRASLSADIRDLRETLASLRRALSCVSVKLFSLAVASSTLILGLHVLYVRVLLDHWSSGRARGPSL